MTYNWNKDLTRYQVASSILLQIVDSIYSINNEVEFAVRAYGTQYPSQDKNCFDTRLEVPFNMQNVLQIKSRMSYLQPIGYSPIAYSLRQAAENELNNSQQYDYSLIFITDGGESCDGNVCETFNNFIKQKIKVTPYVIGLDQNEQLKDYYDCMGNFIDVSTARDIDKAVSLIVDANRTLLNKPKQYQLTTTLSNTPKIKDNPITPKKDNITPSKPNQRKLTVFPILRLQRNQTIVKNRILITPSYIIANKSQTIQIQLGNMESTPTSSPAIRRQTDIIPRMKNIRFAYRKPPFAGFPNATVYSYTEKQVVIKLDGLELPPPPIARTTSVMPRLRNSSIPKLSKPKPALTARTLSNAKQKVRLEFDPEVKRINHLLPRLQNHNYVYKTGRPKLDPAKLKNATKAIVKIQFDPEPSALKKESLTNLKSIRYPGRISYAFRLPNKTLPSPYKTVRVNIPMDAPPAKRDTIVRKPEEPKTADDLVFTVETENASKTQVQVFFKGTNGKTYPNAKPEIQLKEKPSGKVLSSFKRNTSGGNPVPQDVPHGTFDLVVTGFQDLYAKNVVIEENKLNKVYINVADATLHFYYMGNRNRPVEYNAVVNRRFAVGETVLQRCADKRQYEPGTYYVEITTLPTSKYSIDLSFGLVYEIQLQEPGYLQFTNTSPYGSIDLQCPLGDDFATFKTVAITGNSAAQRFNIQPGIYKAIIPVDPKMPQAGKKTIEFRIQSNKETAIELK